VRGRWRIPQATSGTASGSAASRWRGGNQKPNIVGARNAATSSCAPSAAAQSPAASSISRTPGTARARRSLDERHSHHSPANASRKTGAQRSRPYSRSMNSATSRYARSMYPPGNDASVALSPGTSAAYGVGPP
jgi:hypothetical protein